MLIDKLHCDTAAQRLAHQGRMSDAELVEEIAQPHGKRTQRVIAARLGRVTVPKQVRRYDAEVLRQLRQYRSPRGRTPSHAMDQQHNITVTGVAVRDTVTVQLEKFQFSHADVAPF
jgi:hypothetical protein